MKILVCLDGSQYAKGGIDPAARLAEESHSEVHLLSVVDLSQVHERARGFVEAAHGRAVDLSGGIVPGAEGGSGDSRRRDEPDLVEDRDQALTRAGRGAGRAAAGGAPLPQSRVRRRGGQRLPGYRDHRLRP